ncbi:MAG TPA: hypothetical protein PLS03_13400 [Terrimicrobiaceae bacterium]|nr:hypothetical protein [Terrimicrobiaceae bacterium]
MSQCLRVAALASLFGLVGCGWASGRENVGEREIFWGTPNFDYGERFLPPEKLPEAGISYVSHLLYWADAEPAAGRWDEDFLKRQRDFVDRLNAQGVRSGIRLGEAHPGAREWNEENGKPYRGRNPGAYPHEQDTDERYFAYLSRMARMMKGAVDHYVLGDELDMIYGASFRNEDRLREYYEFFVRAAKVIRKEDPDAKLVVFPFAWGETVRNATLLDDWGLERVAQGFCLNISAADCENPRYLSEIAEGIRALSPQYGLYSNGFGYLSNLLNEEAQAARLAFAMAAIWEAGWNFLPYYTLADNVHPWSSGLYREDLVRGGVIRREAAEVFVRMSGLLSRKPRLSQRLRVVSFDTPFGPADASDLPVRAQWQSDGDLSFGLLGFLHSGDPRILRVNLEVPAGPEGAVLQAENALTGEAAELPHQPLPGGRAVAASCEIRDELTILRWKVKP